jgi:DNA mismatch repair protein MutL
MSKIHVLDQQTANSIAAGEVVERPASVVKELVENALDADASVISVEIRQGGISLIRVTDNGCGMEPDDALQAFGRHATSKIKRIEDLDNLVTMGFRGEALASMAAVSRVRLETRTRAAAEGFFVSIAAGEMLDSGPAGCPPGTAVSVENLFFNVPARFKFLRKDTTEAGMIAEIIERLALARPDVSFRLVSNQQEVLHTPGNNDLASAVFAIYGKQTAAACLSLTGSNPPMTVSGFVGRPDIARNSRAQQNFYVNGRLVRSRAVSAALDDACGGFLMKGKYALAILFLQVPPQLVDVNVHPQKMEVRFWNDSEVYRLIYHAVQEAFRAGGGIIAAEEAPMPAAGASTTVSGQGLPLREGEPAVYGEPGVAPDPNISAAGVSFLDKEATSGEIWIQPSLPLTPEQQVQPVSLSVNDLVNCRLIGQLFQTYILLEADEDLLLVDQHAAHEKILYEALVNRHRDAAGREPAEISLLVPLVVEVSRSEMQLLQAHGDQLHQLGFRFDIFGQSSIALRSLPDSGRLALRPEAAFRLAMEALREESFSTTEQVHNLFDRLACHAAVKANDALDQTEIQRLLDDLKQLDNPYQCPHGRPVIIRIPQRELEKRFKRIV